MRRLAASLASTCALALALAPPASARDAIVTSFDGTPIVTHFFPAPGLAAGERAPTIMVGHGWGGSGATSPPEHLASAGYNVLTWDARGFGGSGGTVMIDHPEFEGRDAQALIDFIAQQPEAQLDGPGDPRVGMDGPSYGGGIQFVTAARDHRVDAITPTIAWNSLNRALYRSQVVKSGWDLALAGLGVPTALLPGVFSPAGVQTGHQSDLFYDAVVDGASSGRLSPEFQQFLREHGPDFLLDRIAAPTMIVQGTADTLFTLDEADANFRALKDNGIPLRMMWFCGGHGVCLTKSDASGVSAISGDGGRVLERKLAWFARYLRGEQTDTGPGFEWIDENGDWHASDDYPLEVAGTVTSEGEGTLPLTPGANPGSGLLVAATPSPVAVNVPIDVPAGRDVLGEPRLRLTYRATGASTRPDGATAIFAQLVDQQRNVVVDNLATPIPIALDGAEHTIELPLERIASRSTEAGYRLQLIGQTSVYDLQRATGVVDVAKARIELPLAQPTPVAASSEHCANRIVGRRGRDRLEGTAGSDRLGGRHGADRLAGRGGDDCLRGGRGADRLRGGSGADELRGGRGKDRLAGGSDADRLRPGRGPDRVRAGAGPDTVRAARGGRDRIDCGAGRDRVVVDPRFDRWRRCERVRRR